MSSKFWLSTFFIGLLMALGAIESIHFLSFYVADKRIGPDARARVIRHTPSMVYRKTNWLAEKDIKQVFIGSSRVAHLKIPDKINGKPAYNLGLSATHIYEVLDMGTYVIRETQVQRIYVGLDYLGFISPRAHQELQYSLAEKLDRLAVKHFGRTSLTRAYKRLVGDFSGFDYDIRTGNRIFDDQEVSDRRDRLYTESLDEALQARVPLLKTDLIEQGLSHLDQFLFEAKEHNVEVILYITPAKTSLLNQFASHGFDDSIQQWKAELRKRGDIIDLFYRLPEEQQALFWDPTHILQSHSSFIFENVIPEDSRY